MTWHLRRLSETTPTPWRNGGGTTRVLQAWPDAANWHWRLSVADVAQGGPFSAYPGVRRWLAVVQGDGLQLTLAQRAHLLHVGTEPFDFDGDTPVDCELLGGPTQDVNLMLARGLKGQMTRITESHVCTLNAPKTIAIYPYATRASVLFNADVLTLEPGTLAWQNLPVGSQIKVHAEHALWMEIDPCP